MASFKNNIINIYKEEGRTWYNNLPYLVKKIAVAWKLTDLHPITNLSYHYVLSGCQGKEPIILKLYPENNVLSKELLALEAFAKYGAV